jgi:glycosidase
VATQQASPGSTFHLYRRLIQLRRTRPSLTCGAQDLFLLPGDVLGYARHTPGETTVVVLNFSISRASIDLTQIPQASLSDLTVTVSTHPRPGSPKIPAGATMELEGLEGAVLTATLT